MSISYNDLSEFEVAIKRDYEHARYIKRKAQGKTAANPNSKTKRIYTNGIPRNIIRVQKEEEAKKQKEEDLRKQNINKATRNIRKKIYTEISRKTKEYRRYNAAYMKYYSARRNGKLTQEIIDMFTEEKRIWEKYGENVRKLAVEKAGELRV